ncbi:hypothetical protein L1887_08451 [Cichorium endivia]|nr:hypothetical protein L1887_08451 [Cichorium endivia]
MCRKIEDLSKEDLETNTSSARELKYNRVASRRVKLGSRNIYHSLKLKDILRAKNSKRSRSMSRDTQGKIRSGNGKVSSADSLNSISNEIEKRTEMRNEVSYCMDGANQDQILNIEGEGVQICNQ